MSLSFVEPTSFPSRLAAPRWLRLLGVTALTGLILMTVSAVLFGVPFFRV